MNFNKCSRCGGFFLAQGNVCPNCEAKDQIEINRLKNYIEETNSCDYRMDTVISSTGILNKNLNRFLAQDQFIDFANTLHKNELL